MPYIDNQTVHDADAHIMETAEFLAQFASTQVKEHILGIDGSSRVASTAADLESVLARQADPDYRARDAEEIMLRKNWAATGALFKEDRPAALDLIGVASQLIFNTFINGHLAYLEKHSDDLDLIYGVADAHNRAMLDFCSVDKRLLPTAYVPLADFDRTRTTAEGAIADGFAGLLIPSQCPRTHSPSHTGLFPLWAMAEEAGLPILFHVGGGGELLDPMYFQNGLPIPPDFHGGAENFRSVDYMAIPTPVMQTLATLLIDGIMERHPALMFGVIEQGAGWLPSWMRYLDSAHAAFVRMEDRLQALSLKPSEYVRRQIRATPYPAEDVGWIIREAGPEIPLFSSDYPHVEGGRNPVKRFETTLADIGSEREGFYRRNFEGLMGSALPV
ncbi:MAG: amidohydrolase family protein [Gammaproteobacteria bacterium]|nr:amidohydrolase family protein [Gammaproteobacteria bacterium]